MNKKQSKRQRDIKTKLMAAICMLLVSSIMMVSTTYAWFTLSTAPEVTGINTAVGANGNLEMALLPLDGDVNKITSATNQSMAVQPAKVSNVTWGNLVKLDGTGDQGYGLEKISLYPSALNATIAGEGASAVYTLLDNPLSTPVYGADGRIAEMKANTVTGTYRDGDFYESEAFEGGTTGPGYGVRGIGTVSGMSPRNLAYRQVLASANTYSSKAKSVASTSLNSNGSILADVAITHALNKGTAQDVYDEADLTAMKNVVSDLLGPTEEVVGSLEYIEMALKNYIIASTIAASSTEENYTELQETISNATLANLAAGSVSGAVVSSEMKTWIGTLQTAVTNVTKAHTALNGLSGGQYTWEQISPALEPLVNTNGLLINDTPVADVMADPGSLAGSIMKNGLILTMGSGSGVFSDIADFCGNYSAGIIIPKLAYGTMEVPDVEATMNTATSVNPVYLTAAANAVATFQDATGNGGDNPMSDFYGYIIDLAFRTNAADSYLQIQPDAVDRIYADGTNVNTMGHGATMSFTSVDTANFTTAAVTRLMGSIRIIFFDTATKQVINFARLNAEKATTDEAGKVTMPLVICDNAGNAKTDDAGTTDHNEALSIMKLNQNEVHQLSVMVYLDGETVGNDDVAVSAAQSMTGSMNLQFSSSATLVAMDYADLKSGDGGALNGGNNQGSGTPEASEITVASITDGYSATAGFGTYGTLKGICAKITATGGAEITATEATVTIDGQGATYVPGAGWVLQAETAPSAGVAIVVTPVTGG